jgi:hypothetical protein
MVGAWEGAAEGGADGTEVVGKADGEKVLTNEHIPIERTTIKSIK